MLGSKALSVPDSCCHTESPNCGSRIFQTTDLRSGSFDSRFID